MTTTVPGVLRTSVWVDDANMVRTDVVWIDTNGEKWSARIGFTAEQALDYAEKLRHEGQTLLRSAPRPEPT
jgi:hypothetical protein